MSPLPKIGLTAKRLAKFHSLVDHGDPFGCWPWKGGMNGGHGCFYTKHTRQANRIAWAVVNGPIPAGMSIVPTCDNRRCCNPDHLKIMPAKVAAGIRRAA
jgi:HNH endonuclease